MAFQGNWKWCKLCQSLAFAGSGKEACQGNTSGNGVHDFSSSGDYMVINNEADAPGQGGWRYCQKCSQLCFTGGPKVGNCAGGGAHDFSASGLYNVVTGQQNWYWCDQCQTMSYNHDPWFIYPTLGPCPGPGPSPYHVNTSSGGYTMITGNPNNSGR